MKTLEQKEALNEIQTELNKNWGNQPKSWWNVRLNIIREQQEKKDKLLELYRQWVSLEYSPFDREKLMAKIQKLEEEME